MNGCLGKAKGYKEDGSISKPRFALHAVAQFLSPRNSHSVSPPGALVKRQIPGWDPRFRVSIQPRLPPPGGVDAGTAGHRDVMALCLWENKTNLAVNN